jgi:aminomethyltransferase
MDKQDEQGLQKTELYDTHVALGARMAGFGGFLMPIQYEGIIGEHKAARTNAALFDTCHMGEFRISGAGALDDLERLLSCDVASLRVGRCRYGLMCNPEGGVLDDLLVYRLGDDAFMLVVNAGTQQADFEWISAHLSDRTAGENISDETAKVDLQGPGSARIMQVLMTDSIADLKFYTFRHNRYEGEEVLVSRTGYTGELGFEFYGPAPLACRFWQDCMELGAVPAGLGARDTLRLEMGMPLYGHELGPGRNAAEAGFARAISEGKTFIGSDVVRDPALRTARLVGIEFEGRRAVRHGDVLIDEAGDEIGTVTSGSFAPSLGKAIALGYVVSTRAGTATPVAARTARQVLPGSLCALPFYKDATGRRPVADFL